MKLSAGYTHVTLSTSIYVEDAYQVVTTGQPVEVVGQQPATHSVPYVVNRHVLSTAQARVDSVGHQGQCTNTSWPVCIGVRRLEDYEPKS